MVDSDVKRGPFFFWEYFIWAERIEKLFLLQQNERIKPNQYFNGFNVASSDDLWQNSENNMGSKNSLQSSAWSERSELWAWPMSSILCKYKKNVNF